VAKTGTLSSASVLTKQRREMRHDGDRPVCDIHVVNRPLIEMVSDDRVAGAVVGVFADPAWTQHAAVADLKQSSLQMIGRVSPLLFDRLQVTTKRATSLQPKAARD
jgi:hypothetical protein